MTYLSALDQHFEEARVSPVGIRLARGLPDWEHSARNATHFYVDGDRICFLFPAAKRHKNFRDTLEISERLGYIFPGDAEKICQAFDAYCRQQPDGHLPKLHGLQNLINRLVEKVVPT